MYLFQSFAFVFDQCKIQLISFLEVILRCHKSYSYTLQTNRQVWQSTVDKNNGDKTALDEKS